MGKGNKKKKKEKKGKGKEKVWKSMEFKLICKTEKKTEKNQAKMLQRLKGDEEDVEKIIESLQKTVTPSKPPDFQDLEKPHNIEEIVPNPSPRTNASLLSNPNKSNELILFGGEFFDGQLSHLYNDLYRFNTEKNEWKKITTPNPPPPRCSHQACIYK